MSIWWWMMLVVLLVAVLPSWPYSASWGYKPGGVVGLIVLILVVLAFQGRL